MTHFDSAYGGFNAFAHTSLQYELDFPFDSEDVKLPALPYPAHRFNRRGECIYSDTLGPAYRSTIERASRGLNRVDFTGAIIDSPETLASLFSVYRNPRYEHFHSIILDNNNVIVAHNALSSGLHSATQIHVSTNLARSFHHLNERFSRAGGSQLILLHNHPSSKVTPSSNDINLTAQIADNFPSFRYHIIIDHTEFSHLRVVGDAVACETYSSTYAPFNGLSAIGVAKVQGPSQAANIAIDTLHGTNSSALLALTISDTIAAWRPCSSYSPVAAHNFLMSCGSHRGIYVTSDEALWQNSIEVELKQRTQLGGKYGNLVDSLYIPENYSDAAKNFKSAVMDANAELLTLPTHTDYKMRLKSLKSRSSYEW